MLRIKLCSIFVDDQTKALRFYTDVLGFVKSQDIPVGEFRWITVRSADGGDTELALEPNANPAARTYQQALLAQGFRRRRSRSTTSQAEYERLRGRGVEFKARRRRWGPSRRPSSLDTCGNLIHALPASALLAGAPRSTGIVARSRVDGPPREQPLVVGELELADRGPRSRRRRLPSSSLRTTASTAIEGISGPSSPSARRCHERSTASPAAVRPRTATNMPPRCSPQRTTFVMKCINGASGDSERTRPERTR